MSIKTVVAFLLGAGIGSVGTYFGVKKYFENYMNEEIDSVKDYYKDLGEDMKNQIDDLEIILNDDETKPEMAEKEAAEELDYEEMIQKLNYGAFSSKEKKSEAASVVEDQKNVPYVIDADAFAGDISNEKVTLTYFKEDGVFMDEYYELVSNGPELVGESNLDRFGEFEEDVLYVRNDLMRTDYEIILEHCAYAESEYCDHGEEDE